MIVFLLGDWRAHALRGGAAILFGIVALVWPGITLWALVLLFGAYAFVDGVSILAAVARGAPATRPHRALHVVEGLAGVGAGIVTVVWPGITALALLYVIAAWALLTGALEIAAAIRLRRAIRNEWILGVLGLLSVLFAVVLVITPGTGALAITWVIGWYALIDGVLLLALAWRLRKLEVERGGGAVGQARPIAT
jgi:uncharacterized membrane protein HdeD (DUF308 family)